LREVVDLYISSRGTTVTLRKEDEAFFKDGLPLICRSLNKVLLEDALDLSDFFGIQAEDSLKLNTIVNSHLTDLSNHQKELESLRRNYLLKAYEFSLLTNQTCERLLQIIEQVKSGISARASKTQAKHLALVSESFEGKLKIMKYEALEKLYTPETIRALIEYKEQLEDSRIVWLRKKRDLERDLAAYEASGKEAKTMVARYSKVLKAIEDTKGDIRRLGGDV